ncbi:MAG: hypothetical protein JXD23_07170 [Spirochaetales bacterium]|nr:hypothetical protein [Spirochaetales bacterium]
MEIKHFGLACRTEEEADRFFGELLGLNKSERKAIPASITLPLFGVDGGLDAYDYSGPGLHFEVFIHDDPAERSERIAHVCLAVPDPEAFLEQAECLGFPALRIPRGDGKVYFVKDPSGRLYEIKRAAP